MKKFLFSMALALGAICMPSQASAAEVSSPVVNNIKATTTFQATPSNGPVGAPDKPCGVGRADANPKLLLNDT